ncbi:hypothetical protein AAFC00_004891 [Neodothiora populina]|uniref:Uncharacterized protein n=1 Tax=Neodothiora populina TaxID=2781224 RepID=A0ABR3P3I9_9PEZI
MFKAKLKRATHFMNCSAMCDELAGTLKQVRIDPAIPTDAFQSIEEVYDPRFTSQAVPNSNPSAGYTVKGTSALPHNSDNRIEEWDDGGIDDAEFEKAAEGGDEFGDVDEFESDAGGHEETHSKPLTRLANGKWACSHHCKDKTSCAHLCCREGLSGKPKSKSKSKPEPKTKPKPKASTGVNQGLRKISEKLGSKTQSKLVLKSQKRKPQAGTTSAQLEHIDLSKASPANRRHPIPTSSSVTSLSLLHKNTASTNRIPTLRDQKSPQQAMLDNGTGLNSPNEYDDPFPDDFFDIAMVDDLPDPSTFPRNRGDREMEAQRRDVTTAESAYVEDDSDLLDAALIGAEDSHKLQELSDAAGSPSTIDRDIGCSMRSDHETRCTFPVPSSDSCLFVSQQRSGAVPYLPPSSSSLYLLAVDPEKRKAPDEAGCAIEAKRPKGDDPTVFQSGIPRFGRSMITASHDSPLPSNMVDPSVAKDAEMEELRKWLAEEFGDSIELVESMD